MVHCPLALSGARLAAFVPVAAVPSGVTDRVVALLVVRSAPRCGDRPGDRSEQPTRTTSAPTATDQEAMTIPGG